MVDDVLVAGGSAKQVKERLDELFERCRKHGIMLNRKKIQFGQTVIFAGLQLDGSSGKLSVEPDPARLQSVKEFPVPKCKSDV